MNEKLPEGQKKIQKSKRNGPGNKIKFEDCFIAFLDILGMKNILDEIENNQELAKNIINALNINSEFRHTKETSKHGDIEIRSFYFSDSFVFIVKKEKNNLPHLLLIIRFLQDRFWEKGFCFRGAITNGKMYWPSREENILLGKGIVKAYSLESEIAIYPRIIISDDLFKYVENEDIDGYPFTKRNIKIKDAIIKGKDDIFFLDLLNKNVLRPKGEKIKEQSGKFSITWDNENETNYEEIIKSVKKIISENLNPNTSDEKIKQKYEWLSSYLEEKVNKYE